jgi:hypothetical protein
VCPAKHLAFKHFQTIDLALHRPIAPWQRDPRFDRSIIFTEPFGEPPERTHQTFTGAYQPGIELRRLAFRYTAVACRRRRFPSQRAARSR